MSLNDRPTPRQIYEALKAIYVDIIFVRAADGYQCFGDDARKVREVCGLPQSQHDLHIPEEMFGEYRKRVVAAGYDIIEAEDEGL